MGNKQGKLSLRNNSLDEERQPLLKSNDEEYVPVMTLPDMSNEKDIPTLNLENSANDVESIPSEILVKSSNAEIEVPVGNLVDLSDVVEDKPMENPRNISYAVDSVVSKTLAQDLNDMNNLSLDVIIKFADNLKNLSLEKMSLKNLMKLLAAGDLPLGISGPSKEIFCLRIYVPDCYVSPNMEMKCSEILKFYEFLACVHANDSTTCLIHISHYNNQRKKVLDCTLVDSKFTNEVTNYVIYLWDSKQKTWRLITPDCNEMDWDKCFPEAEVWAQIINCSQNNLETVKFLSQSTLSTNLPLRIVESFDCETHLTTYNFKLQKVIDLSLVQGRKYDERTEFYIEWRGLNSGGYCFTARNDPKPPRE